MRVLLLLAVISGLSGCTGNPGGARTVEAPGAVGSQGRTEAKPIITPATGLAGKVIRVNPTSRFVVLSFPIGRMPAEEQTLQVFRGGLKVGVLRVTGPQVDDKTVADVVEGQIAVGDQVVDQ